MKQAIKDKLIKFLGVNPDEHQVEIKELKAATRDSLIVLSTQLAESVKAIEKLIKSVE